MKTKIVSYSLNEITVDLINKLSEEERRPKSTIIAMAVEMYARGTSHERYP